MKYPAQRILIVVAVQTMVLVAMIGIKQWTLNTGTPIVLETDPIDPRSLFRGDYVRLNYKISMLALEDFEIDRKFEKRDRIYVLLKAGEPYWNPVSLHHVPPPSRANHVAIKGKVWGYGWTRDEARKKSIRNLRVVYGIENYFVPEGEGMALEQPAAGEKVTIQVAVDRGGNAGIKAVLVNGDPRYTESLF